ncbi:hypothetical protein PTSG_07173 [Salpingoeca rosetta]|uniref:Cation-transporting ATPase n=1 Tax=Salpingoeca rosetta (strain ATCC 50818 / BSB-021) TaxID=946362 RepID=F2UE98_SALR5|nr:uncharacterized protein PTSG_07173 [Salpingoeca rosetta]EGD74948.1 hypothetical protein PTSG_07173 [Salpingoeca rosetta]|eukprot:XP_004992593.1 hypothetical protein PTSG_07173 [Salpingoeca rosetta]
MAKSYGTAHAPLVGSSPDPADSVWRRPYRVACDVLPHADFEDDDPPIYVDCRRYVTGKQLLYWLLTLLTVGLLPLVCKWKPTWSAMLQTTCCRVGRADVLVVTRRSKGQGVERVRTYTPAAPNAAKMIAFEHRHVRFVLDMDTSTFVRVVDLSQHTTIAKLHALVHKPRDVEVSEDEFLHGANSIDVEVKSYFALLIDEVLTPFYLFQAFAIGLWCIDEYYYYAGCIFFISLVSVVLTLVETRRNAEKLHDMAAFHARIKRIHPSHDPNTDVLTEEVDATQLLPGDMVEIEEGAEMPCDAAIVLGGCLVNESMLTGESVPVTKTCLPTDAVEVEHEYAPTTHRAHTLFRGTFVMQRRTPVVRAIVVRTGFNTSKGQLVRSILYPKGTRFRFYEDGLKFLMVLGVLALAGFAYTIVVLQRHGVSVDHIVVRGLDLITTVVPPALPAAMTIGTMYALARLKKQKIFCISPPRVNVAGKLKLFCFDKTGTLTEDGLHLWGMRDVDTTTRRFEALNQSGTLYGAPSALGMLGACASCHSLAVLKKSADTTMPELLSMLEEADPTPGHRTLRDGAPAWSRNASTTGSSAGSAVGSSVGSTRSSRSGSGRGSSPANASAHVHTNHALPRQDLVGDPLEVQLFEATRWRLSEPGDAEHAYVPSIAAPYTYVHPPDDHDAAFVLQSRKNKGNGKDAAAAAAAAAAARHTRGRRHARYTESSADGCSHNDIGACDDDGDSDIWGNGHSGTKRTTAWSDSTAPTSGHGSTSGDVNNDNSGADGDGAEEHAANAGSTATNSPASRVHPWNQMTSSGLAVLKHYTFSSRNQRMAVLVGSCVSTPAHGVQEGPVYCYVKGAPERVAKLCDPATVPTDFHEQLRTYTQQGLRVLAVAGREVPGSWAEAKALTRDVIESKLTLLGFTIFENRVKPRTAATIEKLSNACIRSLMITGDNILTACSVAKTCGMVPEQGVLVQAHVIDARDSQWRMLHRPAEAPLQLCMNGSSTGGGDGSRHGHSSAAADRRDDDAGDDDSYDDDDDDDDDVAYGGSSSSSSSSNRDKNKRRGKNGAAKTSSSSSSQSSSSCTSSSDSRYKLVLELIDTDARVDVGMEPDGLQFVRFTKLAGQPPASTWRSKHHARAPKISIAVSGAELAMLRKHCFEDYQRLIVSGTVFARMSPDQKTQLIEDLIELGYCVGMCGDGANDCGALKAAHVGVSLSEAEASVAAPFTSTVPDIDCVQTLIREGRCALVTSFSCFKFMALYSFVEFTSVLILYWIDSNLGDFEYLYVDLFVILSLAVSMGRTGPYTKLSKRRPAGSLVTAIIIVSLLMQISVHMLFQAGASILLQQQSWFVPLKPDAHKDNIEGFENTVVFLVANFQYVWVSIAFSISKPFRAGLASNLWYLGVVVVLLALDAFLVLHPSGWLADVLQIVHLPSPRFRLWLLALAVGNFIVSYSLERLVVMSSVFRQAVRALRRKRAYKNKYKEVAKEVIVSDWAVGKVAMRMDSGTDSTA